MVTEKRNNAVLGLFQKKTNIHYLVTSFWRYLLSNFQLCIWGNCPLYDYSVLCPLDVSSCQKDRDLPVELARNSEAQLGEVRSFSKQNEAEAIQKPKEFCLPSCLSQELHEK